MLSPFPSDVMDAMARRYHRTWVRSALYLALVGYSISTVVTLVLMPEEAFPDVLTECAALVATIVALVALRKGHTVSAAMIVSLVIWLEIHVGLFLSGDINAAGIPVLPVVVTVTGLLVGGRVALLQAAVTAVSVPVVIMFGARLDPAKPGLGQDEILDVVVLAICLIASAIIVHLTLIALGNMFRTSRDRERKFTDLVNNAPDGIVTLDSEGRIDALNPAAEEILGRDSSATRGHRLDEYLLGGMDSSAPVRGLVKPEGSEPVALLIEQFGGHLVHAEATARAMGEKEARGIQIMLRDVTERKAVEEHAVQLGRIIEGALQEIYIFRTDDLGLLLVNRGARENLGFSLAELAGQGASVINPGISRATVEELTTGASASEASVLFSHSIHRRKDGSVYPVEMRLQLVEFGGEPAVVAFALDVTERAAVEEEREKLQSQLQQSQKMEALGHLAGGVAHDFNNLLTVVGGYAELLTSSRDSDVRDIGLEIGKAHERGAGLTKQLLSFARKDVVQPTVLSPGKVVEGMTALLERLVGATTVLRVSTPAGGCIVADRTQLEQIVINLVANARDAMPDGGRVNVEVSDSNREENWVCLTVADNGKGMDESTRDRMFDPFFTTKPRGKGTGLGLSTVHGIVADNGGTVDVTSSPGNGTTIRIDWPATSKAEEGHDGSTVLVEGLALRGTVLVVEDDEMTRSLVHRTLEEAGLKVLTAADGERGLVVGTDNASEIDLVLSDVVMPKLGGFDMAVRLRRENPTLRVLFMSGYVDGQYSSDDSVFNPTRDLLLKPFTPKELRARVAAALARDDSGS